MSSSPKRVSRREAFAHFSEDHEIKIDSDYRMFLFKIVKSWIFESAVGAVILVNMCMTIYETDLTAYPNQPDSPLWLRVANLVMLVLYAMEVALRMIVLQSHFFTGVINWDTFDLSLVVADIVLQLLAAVASLDNIGLARALRIARSLRLVKAIRIWPAFRELYVMMHGLIGACKAMAWAAVLMFLVLALFGIVAVETINPLAREIDSAGGYSGCERCHRSFATVWDSMLTFFQQVVAGDSWGLVTIPIMELYPLTGPFFLMIVVTIQFGILNLILVSIVDQANKCSVEDAQFQVMARQEEYEIARAKLLQVCREIDTDCSGEISIVELTHGYETLPELANQLKFLDVKKEDMDILFTALDPDGSGSVYYEEFVEQLFSMQSQDAGVLLSFVRSYVQDIRKTLRAQTEAIASIQQTHVELKEIMLGNSATSAKKAATPPCVELVKPQMAPGQETEALRQQICGSSSDSTTHSYDSHPGTLSNLDALVKCHLHALELLGQCAEYQQAEAPRMMKLPLNTSLGMGACSADVGTTGDSEVKYSCARAVLGMDVGTAGVPAQSSLVCPAEASSTRGLREAANQIAAEAKRTSGGKNLLDQVGEVSSV